MIPYTILERSASVADLRAQLSTYLSAVKAGEELLITERGRPIARIVPVSEAEAVEGNLLTLVRAGLVREPTASFAEGFFEGPRPRDPDGDGIRAILEERAEGV